MILPEYLAIRQDLLAGASEKHLDAAVCNELVRFLWVQRLHSGELPSGPSEGRADQQHHHQPRPPTASDMSPSEAIDTLLHWVLLNTAVRDKLEAVLGGHISHSTRPAEDDDIAKVRRQLCSMNTMSRCGLTPDLAVWRYPGGTLMQATHALDVHDSQGEVVCTLYVNDIVSTEDSIAAELRQRQLHNVSVSWDSRRREWQARANKRPRLSTEQRTAAPNAGSYVTIATSDGRTLSVLCEPKATVKDLKQYIERQHGHPMQQQRLLFNGRELQDLVVVGSALRAGARVTLNVADTPGASTRHSVRPCHGTQDSMLVMVESADGTTYRVRCNPDDRVADIKLYMRVEHGVPVDQQILIFEDERMEDGKMLSEYDIEDGSTILFMMQQLGC